MDCGSADLQRGRSTDAAHADPVVRGTERTQLAAEECILCEPNRGVTAAVPE